ncbi:MAG: PAS domain-containing hybrid sensor histidine kinase/response regulator [Pseudomonadota bacterium]
MVPSWLALTAALGYIGLLFWIASFGDRRAADQPMRRARPTLYALALAIYCTSWTFFGSVGLAAVSGLDFLTIYVGPILMLTLGAPILRHVIALSKAERITSVADFLSSRYGKSGTVAAFAALISLIGVVPYIALQLKAVSSSVGLFFPPPPVELNPTILADTAFLVALAMAAFAILFGTRTVDTSEQHNGLMLAVAVESVVKLVAFVTVGAFVTFVMFDGLDDLIAQATNIGAFEPITGSISGGGFVAMTLLSAFAIVLLPRQFHILVVENNHPQELRRASWLFPAYLVLINAFVIPIALAGEVLLGGTVDPDLYVLTLPMSAESSVITLIGFVGGLSAATAMVIVACVALSIMISNDLIMPVVVRRRGFEGEAEELGRLVLTIRRVAIFAIVLLAYVYYKAAADTAALAEIGLLSFAAIAQMAPAFFIGLVWKRGTARGATAGMLAGITVWAYTLMTPTLIESGALPAGLLSDGPFGLTILKPEQLFTIAFDPFTHGVFWSLLANILVYILVSLSRQPNPIERLQAQIFTPADLTPAPALRMSRTRVTNAELQAMVARYLGKERTQRSFNSFSEEGRAPMLPMAEATIQTLRFAEQLLASAIGAASSRLVMTLMLRRHQTSTQEAMKLLDDASSAIQYNRDLLQTALDQVRQGISVFDRDLNLICWNRQFRDLLGLPPELGQVGTSLHTILRFNAERGAFGAGTPSKQIDVWVERMVVDMTSFTETMRPSGLVLEVRTNPMPDGGIVATFTDVTQRERAAAELEQANEQLEERVQERTEELTRVNQQLDKARQIAESANISKTRFLAAASHDILQPLNAARLYTSGLAATELPPPVLQQSQNIDRSLQAVEDILGTLLDISRLDAGALKPSVTVFPLKDVFDQLAVEFGPMAREKNLTIRFVNTSVGVQTDKNLLKRLLQNLVSNAIKYTQSGGVVIGVRRQGQRRVVCVYDTGIGLTAREQRTVFEEFRRLDSGVKAAGGLGLGLSIVDRIAQVLNLQVDIASRQGAGSCFSVSVPHVAHILRTGADSGADQPAPRRLEPQIQRSALPGLIVCCIDNDADILQGMAGLLSKWGAIPVTAKTADEAITALSELGAAPNILLADFHLDDGATGTAAVEELRRKFGQELPAILITADRAASTKQLADENGILVLHKPVKPAALRGMLVHAQLPASAAE